ncbi:hypothetical protein BCR44DRAFT_1065965 [Catenaria anguillulae PL171]|uniref:Uncharacterized protein n=1 Tax=Catenaria anguillulae PL171 TaxID=765915 RepID=A0A1Y2H4U0_9FUNG|nr:hypothetical protein BCR44DRAFT_1065965 [Catenaria anguillulae PL171]
MLQQPTRAERLIHAPRSPRRLAQFVVPPSSQRPRHPFRHEQPNQNAYQPPAIRSAHGHSSHDRSAGSYTDDHADLSSRHWNRV